MKDAKFTVRLDAAAFHQLQEVASNEGLAVSEIIRQALYQFLPEQRKPSDCLDAMQSFIGSAGKASADLSTNPAHMKGFGGGD
ncbi:MAG: ribbon-helix-helix domain-containing protein [Holosporales bacterium]|jgi:predicted transcriptional regulator